MRKLRAKINNFLEKILVTILSAMVINVLWQVFSRYFTNNPSSFTDELSRYLMIWLGILGAAYVAESSEHVSIDFFAKKFSLKTQKNISRIISTTVISFAFLAMVVGGSRLVYITAKLQQYSPSLKIPLSLVYAVIPLSGLLIIFYKLTDKK